MAALAAISYKDGWFGEEHDGVRSFRWMSREARCCVEGMRAAAMPWLRLTAGHAWPHESWPVLSVFVNGHVAGQQPVRATFSDYLFPLQAGPDADVRLTLDRTSTPPGDVRDLGIMVRSIDVIDLHSADTAVDAGGWYGWEDDQYFRYRWMGSEARLFVPAALRRCGRFAAIPIYSGMKSGRQTLTLRNCDHAPIEISLLQDWHVYDLVLGDLGGDPDSPLDLAWIVDVLLPLEAHASDSRDLGLAVGAFEVHDDAKRHESFRRFYEAACGPDGRPSADSGDCDREPAAWLASQRDGWYDWEFADRIKFRWMQREARLTVPAPAARGRRFVCVPISSEFPDLSQVLTVSANGEAIAKVTLVGGWNDCSFALPDSIVGPVDLVFRLNKVVPTGDERRDSRELGARVEAPIFHDDEQQHARLSFCQDNAVLNQRELHAGATTLTSFPVNLGIDLLGKCNIKPPCVYCLWDRSKAAEGDDVDAVVDDRTLEEYGNFLYAARTLANCSFGEPLLHPRLTEVLDLLERHRKRADISTNGQAFTPAAVKALAGRDVTLYVSLDAACAPTYARLRNDRWHEVITGLTFLRDARHKAYGLPRVFMVFMPMRANLDDLEAFFRLCRMVGATALVLRPLNYSENAQIYADRGGYHFDYDRELLTTAEQEAVFSRCEQYSKKYEMPVISQFDFEGARRTKSGKS